MKKIFWLFLVLVCNVQLFAQQGYQPSEENLKSRTEFQDEKFGMFIHWGLYSMLGDGEWVMNNRNINWKEYEKLASAFYPSRFDAAAWVSAAKAAGMKYICFTTRHHDGFSMFKTKYSDYNVVDATPFKRDIVKALAEECKKQGLKLHLYYSHLDWRRDDYYPIGKTGLVGRTGQGTGRTTHGKWSDYMNFMNNQLTELLTNYGPIGAIWFDGYWDKDQDPTWDWNLGGQYELIHKLQPGCKIGNNHHSTPLPGEDFQMFERDLPGENTAGLSGQTISRLPLETCETMNRNWGYDITDNNYKTTKEFIHFLVKAAGNNANLLINVGPQPNGEIPATAVQRLKEVGEWMKVYGETIYGTRGGVVPVRDWGVTTQKGNKLFVHILNLKDKALFLPVTNKVKSAVLFKNKTAIKFKQDKEGVLLYLTETPTDVDYVVELSF